MATLKYLSEVDVVDLISVAKAAFPDAPAFTLQGDAGKGRLFSALAQPRWPHHRTLQQKAAVLHYHLNRDHPFIDGNKRFAVAAMEVFLLDNRAVLVATDDELVNFSLQVAASDLNRDGCAAFLSRRMLRTQWTQDSLRRHLDRLSQDELDAIAAATDWLADQESPLPLRIRQEMTALRRAG